MSTEVVVLPQAEIKTELLKNPTHSAKLAELIGVLQSAKPADDKHADCKTRVEGYLKDLDSVAAPGDDGLAKLLAKTDFKISPLQAAGATYSIKGTFVHDLDLSNCGLSKDIDFQHLVMKGALNLQSNDLAELNKLTENAKLEIKGKLDLSQNKFEGKYPPYVVQTVDKDSNPKDLGLTIVVDAVPAAPEKKEGEKEKVYKFKIEGPTAPGMALWMKILIAIVVLSAVGGAVWFFVLRGKDDAEAEADGESDGVDGAEGEE